MPGTTDDDEGAHKRRRTAAYNTVTGLGRTAAVAAASFILLMSGVDFGVDNGAKEPGPGRGAPGVARKSRDQDLNWKRSKFNRMHKQKDLHDPKSELHKKFVKRFRLPVDVFVELCDTVRTTEWGRRIGSPDAARRVGAPVEIYVMATLSHLATGHDFGTSLEWDTGISGTALMAFHHKFCDLFGRVNGAEYQRWVCRPNDEDHELLKKLEQPYALLGLPGCIGSVDGVCTPPRRCVVILSPLVTAVQGSHTVCTQFGTDLFVIHAQHSQSHPLQLSQVHIPWERAPENGRSWYSGKGGTPTIQFNVTITRSGRILHAAGPVPGAVNDKTAVSVRAMSRRSLNHRVPVRSRLTSGVGSGPA